MNHPIPCFLADSDEARLMDEADEMTDGPTLSAPVWLKSEQCAVEKSAKIDVFGLCRVWETWRENPRKLILILHGFLMLTSLRCFDAAYREVESLSELLECEVEA